MKDKKKNKYEEKVKTDLSFFELAKKVATARDVEDVKKKEKEEVK